MKKIIFLTIALIIVVIPLAESKISLAASVLALPVFAQSGSITVISEDANGNAVASAWTLNGPTTISGGGYKTNTFTGEPVGTYTISVPTAPTEYSLTSISPAKSQTLSGGETITFTIVWQSVSATALSCNFGSVHLACVQNACTWVPGAGANQCANDSDCSGSGGSPIGGPGGGGGGGGGVGGGATSTQPGGPPKSLLSFTCYTFPDGTVSCWCPPGSTQVGSSCVLSSSCAQNPDAAGCPSSCDTNPTDPSCNVCDQNPNDPQCQSQACPTVSGGAQQPVWEPAQGKCVIPNSDSEVLIEDSTSGVVGGQEGYSCNQDNVCEIGSGGNYDDSTCLNQCGGSSNTTPNSTGQTGGSNNGCSQNPALQGYAPPQNNPVDCGASGEYCNCGD